MCWDILLRDCPTWRNIKPLRIVLDHWSLRWLYHRLSTHWRSITFWVWSDHSIFWAISGWWVEYKVWLLFQVSSLSWWMRLHSISWRRGLWILFVVGSRLNYSRYNSTNTMSTNSSISPKNMPIISSSPIPSHSTEYLHPPPPSYKSSPLLPSTGSTSIMSINDHPIPSTLISSPSKPVSHYSNSVSSST
jgi:hypothetical protein